MIRDIYNKIIGKTIFAKPDYDENFKIRRDNGLAILCGDIPDSSTKIDGIDWNDIVFYIEGLEKRIKSLEGGFE